ncbi:MAG: GyrI-like domain-containing protein [Verrucomicrobia bacterium]|nr:GyrI-like domain-containing protein [Verrucomicrobiota bacterium]
MKTKKAKPTLSTQPKLDLCQVHKADYATPKKPVLLDIGTACYLAVRGQGRPGGDVFQARIGALYAMAFTVKMTRKFAGLRDYAVCKLEAQYFFVGDPCGIPMDEWRWKLLIRTPDFVKQDDLDRAVATLLKKGKDQDVKEVVLETLIEGRCVQMLHVGPYDREGETIAVMKSFADSRGLKFAGPHHEIYLSDPRRVAPEKLKTILREPVTPA